MKNKFVICVGILSIIFFQGCASTQVLKITDSQKIGEIDVVRTQTTPFMQPSFGSQAVLITGVMFGVVGGGIGGGLSAASEQKNGKKLIDEFDLPDFGQLVFENFRARMSSELPEYPNMVILEEPVTKEGIDESPKTLMIIQNQLLRVANKSGLTSMTVFRILDPAKEKIGLKKFTYNTKQNHGAKKLDELKENNGALLKEEFDAAAKETVSAFILYLKSGE